MTRARAAAHDFLDRLGRRGAMLITFGLTYGLIGYGVLVRPNPMISGAFHQKIPVDLQGALWVASGALAAAYAFRRVDTLGWLALYLMPALRVISYGGSSIAWLVTAGEVGAPTAWYSGAVQVPIILAVLICSGWHEPERLGPRDLKEGGR